MFRGRHAKDFYIFEPTRQMDGQICIPIRFFQRKNVVYACAWPLVRTTLNGQRGWVVEKSQEFECLADDFAQTIENLLKGPYVPDVNIFGK